MNSCTVVTGVERAMHRDVKAVPRGVSYWAYYRTMIYSIGKFTTYIQNPPNSGCDLSLKLPRGSQAFR